MATIDPILLQIRAAGAIAVSSGLANTIADCALRGGPCPVSGVAISRSRGTNPAWKTYRLSPKEDCVQ